MNRNLHDQGLRTLIKVVTYVSVGLVLLIQTVRLTALLQQHEQKTFQTLTSSWLPIESTYHYDGKNSFVPSSDPFLEPLNCLELLGSYRTKKIPQLKDNTDDHPYHKSYLRVTETENPFYLSTNDAKVDYIRVDIFNKGVYYEARMTEAMQDILNYENERLLDDIHESKRPVMIDVGGNVGWFSMLSAAHGAEVYVFEPNVVNMVRLCESAVLNGWSASPIHVYNQLHPYMKGVSNNHGEELKMYKNDPNNPGSFTFSEKAAGGGEVPGGLLQLVTLDALAESQNWLNIDNDDVRIAILKIDVEGLELKVFEGAQKLLRSRKIKNIFMEWKNDEKVEESEEWKNLFSDLIQFGFELFKVGSWGGPDQPVSDKLLNGKELFEFLSNRNDVSNILFRLSGTESNAH